MFVLLRPPNPILNQVRNCLIVIYLLLKLQTNFFLEMLRVRDNNGD